MLGLFDRDFSTLTSSEIAQRSAIDDATTGSGKYGKKNCYLDYPKAVRHNMSLFPNNFMDIADLKETATLEKQCADFESLINDSSTKELAIKRFIQDNNYYHIPASILSSYSFGHHSAYLFKEFKLGTSYIADYALVGKSSDGYQFVFVEFENPYGKVTIANGDFGETIRKGISQIHDWKRFIDSDYSTISSEFKKFTSQQLANEFHSYDSTRMNYVVVAGRRTDYKDKTYRLRRELEKDNTIKLLHYDNLLDISREVIGKSSY